MRYRKVFPIKINVLNQVNILILLKNFILLVVFIKNNEM